MDKLIMTAAQSPGQSNQATIANGPQPGGQSPRLKDGHTTRHNIPFNQSINMPGGGNSGTKGGKTLRYGKMQLQQLKSMN